MTPIPTKYAAAFLLSAAFLTAQTAAPAPAPATSAPAANDETIQLPEFTVTTTANDSSLVGDEATSTTRIATNTFDLPQTVKALNRSMIDLVNPMNLSDMVNYVGGGQTGTLNWTSGRLIIRGFVSDGDYVDGFNPGTQSVVDMFLYDRIEVIKGASAIFNSGTPPGGLVSKITKSPTDYTFANVGVQIGGFDADKAEIDLGGPMPGTDGNLSYRLIATQEESRGYFDYTYLHRALVAPMFRYKFSPDTQVTVKLFYWKTYFPSYNGIPLDPDTLTLFPGVPYTRNLSENEPTNWRQDTVARLETLFTSRLNAFTALRIAAEYGTDKSSRVESVTTTWTDGTVSGAPPAQRGSGEFAVSGGGAFYEAPFVAGTTLLPRSTTGQQLSNPDHDVQTDLDFTFKTWAVSHNLLVGGEFDDTSNRTWSYAGTSSPVNPYAITAPTVNVNMNTPSALTNNLAQNSKAYILETARVLDDRIIVNYGFIKDVNTQDAENDLTHVMTTPQYYVYQNLRMYGAVFKPLPGVAVFYSDSQAFAPNAPSNNQPVPPQIDRTKELGVKLKALNDRLTGNVSYFQASASNNTVPSFPINPVAPTVLIAGIVSHGFDGDLNYQVNPNLFLMGTFADYKAFTPAQPANVAVIQPGLVGGAAYGINGAGIAANASTTLPTQVPVDDVAEHTYSFIARYVFTGGLLDGFDIAPAIDYQCKRAVTNNANQVFFGYIPGRTLVNMYANYRRGHFKYSLNIDNVLDTKYIYSARSVNVVVPGTPINAKLMVQYNF